MQAVTQGDRASLPTAAEPSAWGVYFPSDTYTAQDRRAQLIQELLAALATEQGWQLLSGGVRTAVQHLTACVVGLDYEQLMGLCDSPNLSAALKMQPAEGLLCLQAAVHEVRLATRACPTVCAETHCTTSPHSTLRE